MSAPITIPLAPKIHCAIENRVNDTLINVRVTRGHEWRIFTINIENACRAYPRETEMQSICKASRKLFKAHVDGPASFSGYD